MNGVKINVDYGELEYIVEAYLKKYGEIGMPPEMRYWISTVPSARLNFQTTGALFVRTRFTCKEKYG